MVSTEVVDQGYSSGWVKRISEQVTSEILGATIGGAQIFEVRKLFREKGSRELLDMVSRETDGKNAADALRAFAVVMREFSLKKPALTGVTLQSLGEDGAARLPAASELNATALKLFTTCGVVEERAHHALRMLKSLVRGFTLHEMNTTYLDSLEYDVSFELAVDIFLKGLLVLARE